MINFKTKAAGFAGHAAFNENYNQNQFSNIQFKNQSKKRRPSYVYDLAGYPVTNPVLIAQSWNGLNLMRHHRGGMCLLADEDPSIYDFSMLVNREVWVLRYPTDIKEGLRLGKYIQLAGAKSVSIITLWEGCYYE